VCGVYLMSSLTDVHYYAVDVHTIDYKYIFFQYYLTINIQQLAITSFSLLRNCCVVHVCVHVIVTDISVTSLD